MDEILSIALGEIALEGEQGCTLTTFYDLVSIRLSLSHHHRHQTAENSSSFNGIKLPFDPYIKEYIWNIMRSIKDVSIRNEDHVKELPFAHEDFQKNTVLIASTRLRNQELKLDTINVTWTDQLKRIFQKLLSSREHGISQAQLAKDEDLDPRSCFHYIKILIQAKQCVKIPILASTDSKPNGSKVSTNLLLHTKFKNTSPAYISFTMKSQQMDSILPSATISSASRNNDSNLDQNLQVEHDVSTRIAKQVIIDKMKLLLESAKNKTLRLIDFMAALMDTSTKSRKSLGTIVALLKKGGYVKTFNVKNLEKGKGYITCIQMLKAFPSSSDDKIDPISCGARQSQFLLKADLPLEMQIYRMIAETGSVGIKSTELMHHLYPYLSYKAVMKVLGSLQGQCRNSKVIKKTASAYIKSVHDFDGKMRTSRYFAVDVVSPPPREKKGKGVIVPATDDDGVDTDAEADSGKKAEKEVKESLDGKCSVCKQLLDLNMKQGEESMSSSSYITGFCSKECETLFLVNKTTAVVSANPPSHGLAGKSMHSMRKAKYVEAIIERVRIIEIGSNFTNLIDAESEANGEVVKHTLDRKTIERVLQNLVEEKKIHIIEAATAILGRKRRFVTHASIASSTHPEFKEFIKNAAQEQSKVYTSANREVLEINVESMYCSAAGDADAPRKASRRKPKLSAPKKEDNDAFADLNFYPGDAGDEAGDYNDVVVEGLDESHWLESATKYGFVSEKYVRARLVHLWIFELALQQQTGNIISTLEIFDAMPLKLYLKVVGARKMDPKLDELMADQRAFSECVIGKIPADLKYLISSYNVKRSLAAIMYTLFVFGVVECLEKRNEEEYVDFTPHELHLAPAYRVLFKVSVTIDFLAGVHSKEKTNLCSTADVENFWQGQRIEAKSIPVGQKRLVDLKFKGVVFLRNWEASGLTPNQRQGLLKMTNATSGTTPLRNELLCRTLAHRYEIGLEAVHKFYTDFESRHLRDKQRQRAKALGGDSDSAPIKRMLKRSKLATAKKGAGADVVKKKSTNSNEAEKASEPFEGALARKVREKKMMASLGGKGAKVALLPVPKEIKSLRRGQSNDLDLNIQQPPFTSNQAEDPLSAAADLSEWTEGNKGQRRRANWTSEQDDLLSYGYTVMIKNQKGRGISAQLARKLLPNRMDIHPDAPRRRMKQLKEQPDLQKKFEFIATQWGPFLETAKKENKWYANVNKDNLDVSFLVLVEEFRRFCSLAKGAEDVNLNSDDVKETEQSRMDEVGHSILGRDFLMSDNSIPIDDGLEARISRSSKFNFLKAMTFSIPVHESLADFDFDRNLDVNDLRFGLAATLLKMIMLISQDSYNAKDAYNTLKENFAETDISSALERLKDMSIATKHIKNSDRRLPIRACQISEKALAVLNGVVGKDFVAEARTYWRCVSSITENEPIPESRNPGMMAILVDIWASAGFSLEVPECIPADGMGSDGDFDVQLKRLIQSAERLEKKRKELDSGEDSSVLPSISKKGKKLLKLSSSEDPISNCYDIIHRLAKHSSIEEKFLRELYRSIHVGGVTGKSIVEINDNMDDAWTRENLEIMIALLANAGIIVLVGFDHPRYICAEYEPDWMVYVKKESKEAPGVFVRPEIWNDLNGALSETLYQSCLDSVFQLVMQKPGITEKNIFRRFSALLNNMELRKVLDDLVARGSVQRSSIVAPRKSKGLLGGLFGEEDEYVLDEIVSTYAPSESFNNELVKGLESLKEQRGALQKQLLIEQQQATSLEQQITQLSNNLALAAQEIKKKTLLRDEYDRLISETESAYGKIVESSQTLLRVLNTEVQTLKKH